MKGKKEVKQEIKRMVNELEEMERKAYEATLSLSNVAVYGIIVKNLAAIRGLQNKHNYLITGHGKVFTDIYNEIEELYKKSLEIIKKLK